MIIKKSSGMTVEHILGCLTETYKVLLESSFFMVLGLFMAGLIRCFLKPEFITKYFGAGRIKSIIYASFIGVPIPL